MFLKEIKFQQLKYYDCVSNFLNTNIYMDKNFYNSINNQCKNSDIEQFYNPHFQKSTFLSNHFTSKFLERLDRTYLYLGRNGYNQHICENL